MLVFINICSWPSFKCNFEIWFPHSYPHCLLSVYKNMYVSVFSLSKPLLNLHYHPVASLINHLMNEVFGMCCEDSRQLAAGSFYVQWLSVHFHFHATDRPGSDSAQWGPGVWTFQLMYSGGWPLRLPKTFSELLLSLRLFLLYPADMFIYLRERGSRGWGGVELKE